MSFCIFEEDNSTNYNRQTFIWLLILVTYISYHYRIVKYTFNKNYTHNMFFHSAHLTISKLLHFLFVLICTDNNINKLKF